MRNKSLKSKQIRQIMERVRKLNFDDEQEIDIKDESIPSLLSVPSQWSVLQNETFAPAYASVPKVPAGLYEITWNSSIQSHVLVKQKLNIDELYELPSPEIQSILSDIEIFWERRDTYREYNFVHKRGILLWGEPGCGKSGIIQLCIKNLIDKKNGIVINIKEEEDLRAFSDFIPDFRKIEPDRSIIVILEDLDSLAGEDRYSTTKLLNLLDGVKQIENVVYIATTNYPEKLQERITNRPSRFDRRYQVDMPSSKIREAYIRNKLTKEDLKKVNIKEWVDLTDGMSLSHLKELVVSVVVMGKSFEDSILNLTEMKKSPKLKRSGSVGFRGVK